MSEVNFFELAEIAEASYANLLSSIDIQVEDALQDGRYLSKPFSETQAKQFTATWEVIDYQPNTESSGFSATLFRHKNSDEYVLGIRGTKGLVDLKEDVGNIVADGMAFDQALDLYNYWQKVTHLGNYQAAKLIEVQPPANLTLLQIKQWAHTNGYLFDITIDLSSNRGQTTVYSQIN